MKYPFCHGVNCGRQKVMAGDTVRQQLSWSGTICTLSTTSVYTPVLDKFVKLTAVHVAPFGHDVFFWKTVYPFTQENFYCIFLFHSLILLTLASLGQTKSPNEPDSTVPGNDGKQTKEHKFLHFCLME